MHAGVRPVHLAGLGLVLLAVLPLFGQQQEGKNYALLVGINDYQHHQLPRLRYAVKDVTALHEILSRAGYEIVLLTDDEGRRDAARIPTRANIEKHLQVLREKCRTQRGQAFLVALAGHGLQFQGQKDVHFCPRDGLPEIQQAQTLVSLTAVYQELVNSTAPVKVVLVDACRNDPNQARGKRSFDARTVTVPDGVAALFSCSAGDVALEHDRLQHGVFFYHVLQELRGQGSTARGKVTFNRLADHVMEQVPAGAKQLFGNDAHQTPNQVNNLRTLPVLLTLGQPGLSAELAGPFRNSLGMDLVPIRPGSFRMGSPPGERGRENNDEHPHPVEITHPFWMGKYEVTIGQFQQFVKASHYRTEGERDGTGGTGFNSARGQFEATNTPRYSWRNAGWQVLDAHPVVNVSWNDANAFCEWLSRQEGKKYVLPTEAQWEYCCRAGTTTAYHSGNDPEALARVGNVADATARRMFPTWEGIRAHDGYVFTAPVGRFQPNAFGLHDMHGNVWEWCSDRYGAQYYRTSPPSDPYGPETGENRVFRGGSWSFRPAVARSAYRGWKTAGFRIFDLGFRVACLP